MRYLTFSDQERDSYEICFLVPELHRGDMRRLYVDPHLAGKEDKLLAYSLLKHPKQTPVEMQKDYLRTLLPILKDLHVEYLVTCDAEYFKTLTKGGQPKNLLGYVMETQGEFAGFKVLYCPNFRTAFYNPEKVKKDINQALYGLTTFMEGEYAEPGADIVHFAAYPKTVDEIRNWLQRLYDMDCPLSADIEAFSLKHYDAGIGTISFAWSKHEGIAFPVDLHPDSGLIRAELRGFFRAMSERGTRLIWHKISYDVYVLIYQLFMENLLDTEGLLKGLDIMLSHWDDTLLITYLATNTCAGNRLSLKEQAQEYAGKYALEEGQITDIRSVPLDKLLRYNLMDTLSTWFVYEKHLGRMVADQQLDIYETLFKPAIVDIIQMQLTGLPLDRAEVLKLQEELQQHCDLAVAEIQSNAAVQAFIRKRNLDWVAKKNATLKKKRVSLADAKETFNPNSAPQLQELLYHESCIGLPVIDLTDSKLPATGGDTLEKLLNHTTNQDAIELLNALIDYKSVDKILTSFIPAFLAAPMGPDGWHYLFGFFNLGGTKSGRLSSSDPNLQNLPAKGIWAKAVKRCFKAPPGWLFVGLDFNSLEDMISALTTRDPNKLKVYTDGYDGHCLRAYSYFGDQMPDIDGSTVAGINSIKKKYESLRNSSKTPTFLLTYGGTWRGIIDQLNWPEAKARDVEARYHDLYRVSDQWVAARIAEAGQNGYVTAAFGLRLRTPLLRQVVLKTSRTPYEAEAESRTAGNALGQSWCLLNNRAGIEFNRKARSGEYRLDIRPCAHIHDAQYFLIRDAMPVLLYVNEHLVEAVKWQDHPDIWHDTVKIGGELSVFYPSWAEEMVIPNGADEVVVLEKILEHKDKLAAEGISA